MTDPIKAFMQAHALETPAFAPGSRYHGLEIVQWTRPDGEVVNYVRRRFVPHVDRFATLREVRVNAGDRPDNLAAEHLGDPTQYWRLCDGNGVMHPDELTDTVGRVVRITLPEGVPGADDG